MLSEQTFDPWLQDRLERHLTDPYYEGTTADSYQASLRGIRLRSLRMPESWALVGMTDTGGKGIGMLC